VNAYLAKADLLTPLQALRFNVVGYGCTTCIGNSGPLTSRWSRPSTPATWWWRGVVRHRNFEGRVSPHTRATTWPRRHWWCLRARWRVDIDFEREPIGTGSDGQPVFLRDIWPSSSEIDAAMIAASDPALYRQEYGNVAQSNPDWNAIPADTGSAIYKWREDSTTFSSHRFSSSSAAPIGHRRRAKARALLVLGDFVTTDHISPAGNIAAGTPAARYLLEHGVQKSDWNSYGSRRGNDRVMTRGTFATFVSRMHWWRPRKAAGPNTCRPARSWRCTTRPCATKQTARH